MTVIIDRVLTRMQKNYDCARITGHSSVTLQYTLQHAYGDAVFSLALFMAELLCPGFPCGWIG